LFGAHTTAPRAGVCGGKKARCRQSSGKEAYFCALFLAGQATQTDYSRVVSDNNFTGIY
jgi:hypothetical protein